MTTWNYRVVHHQGQYATSIPVEQEWFDIREVYYGEDGVTITAWSANPMAPHGETLVELLSDMNMMIKAFTEPTLNAEELPEYKER